MKFKSIVEILKDHKIVRIPPEISRQLPSRGMVMMEGKAQDLPFEVVLEPDGKGNHWLELQDETIEKMKVHIGDAIAFDLKVMEHWMVPEVPEDLAEFLKKEELESAWKELTVKARWEWIRWFRSTKNPQTRLKRIGVAIDKLHRGDTRPCCFNSSSCTVPELFKSGVLWMQMLLRQSFRKPKRRSYRLFFCCHH